MKEGVLLTVWGSANWGKYLMQLVASIKFSNPNLPITVAHTGGAMSHIYGRYDEFKKHINLIEIPEKMYWCKDHYDYLKIKTHLNELSPYKKTLYLDTDMIALPKGKTLHSLINSFEDKLVIQNRGCMNIKEVTETPALWADVGEIKENYNIKEGVYYNLASEFIYFEKCKEVTKFFKDAQKIYENPKVSFKRFSGGMPDELALSISLLKNNIQLKSPFLPVYWEASERKNLKQHELYDNYYAYSIGGNLPAQGMDKMYDNLARFFTNWSGIPFFPYSPKRRWVKDRHTR